MINQKKCIEHGLSLSEGALMDLFNQLHSWADEVVINGVVFYKISRYKVAEELPLFFQKGDTAYRLYKSLDRKKLVKYIKHEGEDCIRLTKLGKGWNKLGFESEKQQNSDLNPKKLGFESESRKFSKPDNEAVTEKNSDSNPTYNNIITTRDERVAHARASDFLKQEIPEQFNTWEMQNKSQIDDYKKFLLDFDSKVIIEELKWRPPILMERLKMFARNWIQNSQGKSSRVVALKDTLPSSHPSRQRINIA